MPIPSNYFLALLWLFGDPRVGREGSMQERDVVMPHNHPAAASGAFLAVTNRWHF